MIIIMHKMRNTITKKAVSWLLTLATLLPVAAFATPVVQAGGDTAGIRFSIKSMRVVSSPVEEENNFDVEVTYHAKLTNVCWIETVWNSCSSCSGSGEVWQPGEDSGGDEDGGGEVKFKEETITITCGQGGFKCRSACDGKDYNFTRPKPGGGTSGGTGTVTQNPDGTHNENWTGATIGSVAHDCNCSTEIIKKVPIPGTGGGSGSGGGSSGSMGECSSCGGAGGSSSSIHHMPSEPPSTISTIVTTGIEDNYLDGSKLPMETKTVTFNLSTTELTPDGAGCTHVWTKEGDVTVKWTINAGEKIGPKDVETTINGTTSDKITVDVKPACDLTVQFFDPKVAYRDQTDIVSTFMIYNNNDQLGLNVKPKHKLTVKMVATDANSGKLLGEKTITDLVIPKNRMNNVYFKWSAPKGLTKVNLTCSVNTGYVKNTSGVNEENHNNNSVAVTRSVDKWVPAATYEIEFETKPSWVNLAQVKKSNTAMYREIVGSKSNITSSNSWQEWKWEGGGYALKNYGMKLSVDGKLSVDPNASYETLNRKDNSKKGTLERLRSGYGVSLDLKTNVISTGDPVTRDMYTNAQNANAYFPEFNYEYGVCTKSDRRYPGGSEFRSDYHRALQETSTNGNISNYEFRVNPFSTSVDDSNPKDRKITRGVRRVHFLPIWYPDTEKSSRNSWRKTGPTRPYEVVTFTHDVWTPGGMLSYLDEDMQGVEVVGDLYDDWYLSHETDAIEGKK